MSTPVIRYVSDDDNPYIEALLWKEPDDWTMIAWDNSSPIRVFFADDYAAWSDDEKQHFMAAARTWSAVADIQFEVVTSIDDANLVEHKVGDAELGDNFGMQFGPDAAALDGTFEGGGLTLVENHRAHGYYNADMTDWAELSSPGSIAFNTVVHEIGHGIGLAHPHDSGGSSAMFPGVEELILGENDLDHNFYTMMSYNGDYGFAADGSIEVREGALYDDQFAIGFTASPAAFDIAAAQAIYGSVAANIGDSTYTLLDTATSWVTIYDTNGQFDSIVYAGTTNAFIDLRPASLLNEAGGGGNLSHVANTPGGFTIAADVYIEGAAGGSGDDVLVANDIGNYLNGGAGDDRIQGGAGADFINGGGIGDFAFASASATDAATGETLEIALAAPRASDDETVTVNGLLRLTGGTQQDIFNLVYIFDRSGSMSSSFSGNAVVGDANDDFRSNELIDAAIVAFTSLNGSVVSSGAGASDLGIIAFDTYAELIYTGRADGGVADALENLRTEDWTNFEDALAEAVTFLQSAGTGLNQIIFISDGANNEGGAFTDELQTLIDPSGLNAEIRAIGLGTSADMSQLGMIDNTGGAEIALSPDQLTAGLLGSASASGIDRVELFVNGATTPSAIIRSDQLQMTSEGLLFQADLHGLSISSSDTITARAIAAGPSALSAAATVTIDTGSDDDYLAGGGGSDTYVFEQGFGHDVIDESGGYYDAIMLASGQVDYQLLSSADDANDLDIIVNGIDIITINDFFVDPDHVVETLNLGDGRSISLSGGLTLQGADDEDALRGSQYDDVMIAGAGADWLFGGGGNDTYDGGTGIDFLSFADFFDDLTIDLASAIMTAYSYITGYDTIYNIENIVGGGGDDQVTGGSGSNHFLGGLGSDRLYGGDGDDVLNGGGGDDDIDGGAGFDTADYSDSSAAVSVDIAGGIGQGSDAGTDQLSSIENAIGGSGADTLIGDDANNKFAGGLGDDAIDGGGGDDTVKVSGMRADYSVAGILESFTLGDMVAGRDGADLVENVEWVQFADGLVSARDLMLPGTVRISDVSVTEGDSGTTTATFTVTRSGGNAAFDVAYATRDGSAMADDGDYVSNAGTIHFAADDNVETISVAINGDTMFEQDQIFYVTLSGATNDAVIVGGPARGTIVNDETAVLHFTNSQGTAADDLIVGTSGVDSIAAGARDDLVFGQGGADSITGGTGADTLVGDEDTFAQTADTLDGGSGDDVLYGEFTDHIVGGSGYDILYAVNDYSWTINLGDAGVEWMSAGFGDDNIDAATQAYGVEVYAGGGDDAIVGSAQADIVWAGVGNDSITGGAGDDLLIGDLGADSLSGGDGDDQLYVDAEDTVVDGGAGFDAVYIAGGAGLSIDMAARGVEWVADFSGGNDIFDGSGLTADMTAYAAGGTDAVTGGTGNDFLWGGAGDDTVTGNDGHDVLVGGDGSDTLYGGAGIDAIYANGGGGGDGAADVIVYASAGWGTDFVFDFEHGVDKFDLTGTGATFANLDIVSVDGHAYVTFGTDLIAVANAAGALDETDFTF